MGILADGGSAPKGLTTAGLTAQDLKTLIDLSSAEEVGIPFSAKDRGKSVHEAPNAFTEKPVKPEQLSRRVPKPLEP